MCVTAFLKKLWTEAVIETNRKVMSLSAGTVMFEYGMRLGREVRTLLGLQKQVNCYLAALNCLRLVRLDYAWIVQPSSGAVVSIRH